MGEGRRRPAAENSLGMNMEARIIALGHATSQLATSTTAKHRLFQTLICTEWKEKTLWVFESTCGHWARKDKEDRFGQEMRSFCCIELVFVSSDAMGGAGMSYHTAHSCGGQEGCSKGEEIQISQAGKRMEEGKFVFLVNKQPHYSVVPLRTFKNPREG